MDPDGGRSQEALGALRLRGLHEGESGREELARDVDVGERLHRAERVRAQGGGWGLL